MARILRVGRQPVAREQVRHTLDALPREGHRPGDLRHRGRALLHRLEDEPARQRLARRSGQPLPLGAEEPDELGDLADQGGEGVPGRRPRHAPFVRRGGRIGLRHRRRFPRALDNILSFWYLR
jgi:hypothetical protein